LACEKNHKFDYLKTKERMINVKNKKEKNLHEKKGVVSKSVRDYGNDPFFIKKADDSQKFLEKNGFPSVPKNK
jgi:hypothetical protein